MWYGLSGVLGGEIHEVGPVYDTIEQKLLICHEKQTKIGWDHLVYGRIAKDWIEINKLLQQRDSGKVLEKAGISKK